MRVFDFLPGSFSLSCSFCIHRRSCEVGILKIIIVIIIITLKMQYSLWCERLFLGCCLISKESVICASFAFVNVNIV